MKKKNDYKITGKTKRDSSNPLQILHELEDGSWVPNEKLNAHYSTMTSTDLFEQALRRRQENKNKKKEAETEKPAATESRRLDLIKEILSLDAT